MSERIITLFGEEIVPEQLKSAGKSRGKKKNEQLAENNTDRVAAAPPEEISSSLPESQPAEVTPAGRTPGEGLPAAEQQEIQDQAHTPADEKQTPVKKQKSAANLNLPDDWKGDKQYYAIGEVADLFGVKTSNIRFWTNEFGIKVRTTRKGDRLYTSEQIKEIKTIHHLVKERGFTLAGAKAKLAGPDSLDIKTVDLKQSLLQLRNKLMAIKNQLK